MVKTTRKRCFKKKPSAFKNNLKNGNINTFSKPAPATIFLLQFPPSSRPLGAQVCACGKEQVASSPPSAGPRTPSSYAGRCVGEARVNAGESEATACDELPVQTTAVKATPRAPCQVCELPGLEIQARASRDPEENYTKQRMQLPRG